MKKEITRIKLIEIVGSNLCISSEDGQKVHDEIKKALGNGRCVQLSFEDVSDLTSAFLNSAIGQLYGEFSDALIKEKLSVFDAQKEDLLLLKRIVDRAKEFFKDQRRFESVTDEIMGDDDEPHD